MKLTLSLVMAVLIGLCFTPAWAEEEADFSAGEKLQAYWLGAQAFKPAKGADCLDFKEQREVFWNDDDWCGNRWGNENFPLTSVIRLQSGAKLVNAELYTYDSEKRDPYTIKCELNREDWDSGDNPNTHIMATLSTDPDNNGPGYTTSGRISVQERIKNGDHWYQAVCFLGDQVRAQGTDLRLFGIRILYRTQVQDGLPTAFDDIGHLSPRFQNAINALSASGITNGCNAAGDEFCPDDNLTRGQMAVFLAEALGLYWPLGGGY
ncbi:MAG: S-layer homology domain-containing protein [Nitrospinales bacterium]